MQRRGFLQLGLVGGALLAAGGVSLSLLAPARRATPRRPLLRLDEGAFSVLVAVAARVVPPRDPGAPDPVEVAHRVDEALTRLPIESAADFAKLLGLLDSAVAGLLLDGRPRAFTALDGPSQDAALHAFRDSTLALRRSGYAALRKLCAGAYYADAATWPALGYPGPPAFARDDDGAAFPTAIAPAPSPAPSPAAPASAPTAAAPTAAAPASPAGAATP